MFLAIASVEWVDSALGFELCAWHLDAHKRWLDNKSVASCEI